ncbi:MAG: hypothetical protein AB7K24_13375 [Gemmataceae bacterium]
MGTSPVTIITFVVYILGTFVLAALSHRILAKKSFMGEYFLGSRGLGSWALAFTFAATSSSGGSFTGFPSLIYTHGWILALWIASYMVVPICTMGVLGKRLNQVARKSGAITIPDVLRDRFDSTALGLVATCTIIFFTVSNLVAQFRAGALILQKTLNMGTWSDFMSGDIAGQPVAYLLALVIFATTVVVYTSFGGFRAVVWTDVMQGIVMGLGILVLLPVILIEAGGLRNVNETLLESPPVAVTNLAGTHNDLAFLLKKDAPNPPVGIWYLAPAEANASPAAELVHDKAGKRWLQIRLGTDKNGVPNTTADQIKELVAAQPGLKNTIEGVHDAYDNDGSGTWSVSDDDKARERRWPFIRGDEFLFGPGRRSDGSPFHPLGLAISFFFMWAISGIGQPGTMVRLMAFKESRTLKRAILTVTFYYALIYLPLVFIFVSARTLLPYIPPGENSDQAMVLVATRVVAEKGFLYQILAAIFVAAPFAAVMSTVDSFLLMVSSSLVRDVYQRTINPDVSERAVKIASYTTTAVAGVVVTMLATQRIDFLQYIIVFTGGGFAATFLCPVFLGVYWKGMTRQGALAAMIGGFCVVVGLFAPSMFPTEVAGLTHLLGIKLGSRVNLLGFHPVFWGLGTSFALGILVSKLTGPPPEHLVDKYFLAPAEQVS